MEFAMGENGWTWHVTHADGTEEQSPSAYKTLKDCTADAAQNGYLP